ncbi:DUF4190 domain-containing protein [Shouchella miscanthi]|uniref:DUF4190 domain-containing protein n=1 Tax=Shouchella miscanthi TaxID=2598861 RepID=A0ABU6NJC4_9BACI|nr:DUF4190 domain-containing protein [Shouchella miscanthi]
MPTATTKTNTNAVVSLCFGIVSLILPFVGLLVGVIGVFLAKSALTQIEQSSEAGKGIASAGLVCSVIGIVLQLLLIIGGLSLVFFSIA